MAQEQEGSGIRAWMQAITQQQGRQIVNWGGARLQNELAGLHDLEQLIVDNVALDILDEVCWEDDGEVI